MDEASNTAASNSSEKQKFFAGSVTFCGQRYTCQCRGSSSKSASAVGVDAGHSRNAPSSRTAVTGIGPYMTPANSCCPANFECKAEKMGPPEARRKRPRRNEPPRYARSLLSSASVSSFPNRKRFAGLRLGFGLDGYIKQPHSGRMGLFMHIWVGEVILRK